MFHIPKTMKAWVVVQPGQPNEILQMQTDRPIPAPPKTGEVMIRVSYAAINPGDIKIMAWNIPYRRNTIPGLDFVGEVIQVGPSASNLSLPDVCVGKIVAGSVTFLDMLWGVGTLAEYLVVPTHAIVEAPKGLPVSVAAGLLGVAGQTSVTLLHAAKLHHGQRALVNGASGGVGSILIQMLHGSGVHVTAVCSTKNKELVRRLGANEVIDYVAHESLYGHLVSICSKPGCLMFDAIIDCVGDDTLFYRCPGYLKPDGRYFGIKDGPFGRFKLNNWPVMLGGTPRTYVPVFNSPAGSTAREVVRCHENGWVKEVPIDSIYEMGDAKQAFEKLATKRAVGKILVKLR